MSVAGNKSASDSQPTGMGPGERLQAARIQMGLSLADVAKRMHLSANILESIEENNFDEITAPIFVKGYLRAYARIVRLDEDEMIMQYIEYYSEEDPPITSTSSMASELSVADVRIKSTTYLVILVLCVLLAIWWWNREQGEEAPISLDSQSSTGSISETDAQVVNSDIEALSESQPESAQVVEVTAAPAIPIAPVEEALQAEPVGSIAAPESSAMEPEAVAADPESLGTETVSAAAVVNNEAVLFAPGGPDKLVIVVHADTWADIKDASGYQLVYDLLRADQTVELDGSAPFTVFLGNGHGVEIMFNGEQIEISSKVRDDNTARLKIEQ